MSWHISASGKKAAAIAAVQAQTYAGPDAAQFSAAKDHVLEALDRLPDANVVGVTASGHSDDLVQYESVSITSNPPEADDTNA